VAGRRNGRAPFFDIGNDRSVVIHLFLWSARRSVFRIPLP
jgi:hypothetical protein